MAESVTPVGIPVVARVESVAEVLTLVLPDGERRAMPSVNLLALSDTERASRLAALTGTELVVVIEEGFDGAVRELQAPLRFRATSHEVAAVAIQALRNRLKVFGERLNRFDSLARAQDDVCVQMGLAARLLRNTDCHRSEDMLVEFNRMSGCVNYLVDRWEPRLVLCEKAA